MAAQAIDRQLGFTESRLWELAPALALVQAEYSNASGGSDEVAAVIWPLPIQQTIIRKQHPSTTCPRNPEPLCKHLHEHTLPQPTCKVDRQCLCSKCRNSESLQGGLLLTTSSHRSSYSDLKMAVTWLLKTKRRLVIWLRAKDLAAVSTGCCCTSATAGNGAGVGTLLGGLMLLLLPEATTDAVIPARCCSDDISCWWWWCCWLPDATGSSLSEATCTELACACNAAQAVSVC